MTSFRPSDALKGAFAAVLIACVMLGLPGCASVVASAGSGLAENLSRAMLNQDDPEIVRDGAPAFLLMLDSFVEGAPDNQAVLGAAAELYSAYGVVFVDDPERASKLTTRARDYGRRALCAAEEDTCGVWDLEFDQFVAGLERLDARQAAALYNFGLSWMAWIQAHASDYGALAKLPHVEATMLRLREIDPEFEKTNVARYLGVLNTIRPPALGGDFESGLAHFERAIELAGEEDLSIKVDFARYYARTLYDRDLHDRLLNEVLLAEPRHEGFVLMNVLAQKDARDLMDSADDYF